MIYYEDDCITHLLEKKKMRWATWNVKKSKIAHQIDELSEKSDSKLKSLRMRWREMKEKMKTTSF